MADAVSYLVEAVLKVSGASGAKSEIKQAIAAVDQLAGSTVKMTGGLFQATTGMANLATSAVGMAAKVATVAGGMAIAAGAAAATAVGANLSMLEDKSIQLGSVIGAAAEVPFETAKKASDQLFSEFRKDAISSAGETSDFVQVASSIAGPLIGAGKGMNELHEMTKATMAAAPALGVAFDQAGNDVMRMLQGIAGVHEPLFRAMVSIPTLGIKTAHQFNALSPEKRYEALAKALSNPSFKAAADVAGQSMTGLLSTTSDVLKTMGGLVGTPIFKFFKQGLGSLTSGGISLLDDDDFKRKLGRIGGEAEIGFHRIAIQAARIFPGFEVGVRSATDILGDLAERGMDKLVQGSTWIADHWGEIKGYASQVVDFISEAASKGEAFVKSMGGGDFATGAKRIAEAFIALKGAEVAAPIVGGLGSAVSGAVGIGQVFGAFGGMKAVGGAAAGAAGSAAAGAGAAGAGAAGGGLTMAGVGALAAAAIPYALAAAAAAVTGASVYKGIEHGSAIARMTAKSDEQQNFDATREQMMSMSADGNVEGIQALKYQYLKNVTALYDTGNLSDLEAAITQANAYVENMLQQAKPSALDEMTAAMAGNIQTPMATLVEIYNEAQKTNDKAMAQLAAGTLVASMKTADDLEKAKLELVGGIGKFADILKNDSPEIQNLLNKHFLPLSSTTDIAGKKAKAPDTKGGKQEVIIKWDLGDGNDEAILIRTRRQIVDTLKGATGIVRNGYIPGSGG